MDYAYKFVMANNGIGTEEDYPYQAVQRLCNKDKGIFTGPCSTSLDHAVLIVGYGSEDGVDYWILKNSWGKYWGMNGYMHMLRNSGDSKGACGIYMLASYPTKTGPNPPVPPPPGPIRCNLFTYCSGHGVMGRDALQVMDTDAGVVVTDAGQGTCAHQLFDGMIDMGTDALRVMDTDARIVVTDALRVMDTDAGIVVTDAGQGTGAHQVFDGMYDRPFSATMGTDAGVVVTDAGQGTGAHQVFDEMSDRPFSHLIK